MLVASRASQSARLAVDATEAIVDAAEDKVKDHVKKKIIKGTATEVAYQITKDPKLASKGFTPSRLPAQVVIKNPYIAIAAWKLKKQFDLQAKEDAIAAEARIERERRLVDGSARPIKPTPGVPVTADK
ncbi:MAG: hypothetical protein EXS09_20435 [Gemmataceae bacterium]|nr:hypothetical protein [Gemmataceae bacterium]